MGDEMAPTVRQIIGEWLMSHGYDGLYNDSADCGCLLAEELMPCFEEDTSECRPGYRGVDPDGECEWMMFPRKQEEITGG